MVRYTAQKTPDPSILAVSLFFSGKKSNQKKSAKIITAWNNWKQLIAADKFRFTFLRAKK